MDMDFTPCRFSQYGDGDFLKYELRCPHCSKEFSIDGGENADMIRHLRDAVFEKDLADRVSERAETVRKEMLLSAKEEMFDLRKQYDDKIRAMQADLDKSGLEKEIALSRQKSDFEAALKEKQALIDYYKDFKARMSTKMIGESLEKHCLDEFNRLRAAAFPNAYFEKDNDAKTGSKGDFIFRECDADGTEIVSIMFEMKNEADETATKHKNEDFLKELDKDRNEKHCEYAVLVSLLESDSELYNDGIVDMSHRYGKMYVVRPQFFIPIISLLRNAALSSMDAKRELAGMKSRQTDVLSFERELGDFKKDFGRNHELARRRIGEAVGEIDKAIERLEKVKKALLSSDDNLRLAGKKADSLSIEKLTKNNISVRRMFEK